MARTIMKTDSKSRHPVRSATVNWDKAVAKAIEGCRKELDGIWHFWDFKELQLSDIPSRDKYLGSRKILRKLEKLFQSLECRLLEIRTKYVPDIVDLEVLRRRGPKRREACFPSFTTQYAFCFDGLEPHALDDVENACRDIVEGLADLRNSIWELSEKVPRTIGAHVSERLCEVAHLVYLCRNLISTILDECETLPDENGLFRALK